MQSLARMAEAADQEAAGASQPMLLASAADVDSNSSASRPYGFGPRPGSVFASMSFGMGRASHVILNALTHAAKHAPTRRPRVMRPSQMRKPARQQQQQ